MSKTISASPWEYVVKDFLDITASLKEDNQDYLVTQLQTCQNKKEQEVGDHAAFSIGGRLVTVVEDAQSELEECWLYYPKKQRIEKFKLKRKKRKKSNGQRAMSNE